MRLASLGPVGLPAALRRRGGDGRREARSAARATVPSVKAGRCLRALGAFRRPAVQAKSLLSTETTFDGTYLRSHLERPGADWPTQRDEARYRRSTERDASGDVLSGHRLAALLVPLFPTGRYKVDPDAVAHDSARSWRYRGKVRSCAPHPGQLARPRSPRGCSWPQTTHTASVQRVRTRPSTGSLGGVGAGAESRWDSITCAACQRFARSIGGVGVRRRCCSVLVRAGVRLSVARGHTRARSRIR